MKSLSKFKEFGSKDAPSLKNLFNEEPYPEKNTVILYLKSGKVLGGALRYDKDAFTKCFIEQRHTPCIFTDGEYSWSSELPYYVEKYNVRLPKEFEDKAVKCLVEK